MVPTSCWRKAGCSISIGRYDDAWAAFAEGKRLARELSGQAYLDDEARQQMERLRSFFTAGRLRLMPRAKVRTDVPQPIFISGLSALRHHAGRADAVGAPEASPPATNCR